jgi:hypothetical protein
MTPSFHFLEGGFRMPQFSVVSLNQAEDALGGLARQLSKDFNAEARNDLMTLRVRVERISMAEWGVVVGLKRQPTKEEKLKLPDQYDGVRVRYEIK